MSDLQLGLIAIGVLAIVAVLAFNKWQERASGREAHAAFQSRHADVLLDAPGAAAPHPEPVPTPPRRAARTPDARLAEIALPDPGIDYVLELRSQRPIAGHLLADAWSPAEHRFAQRALFAGNGAQGWRACGDGDEYGEIRAALQLVNRRGRVSDAELLEFRTAVDTLAAKLGASVHAPEIAQAVERGHQLDELCGETDIQVVLHVVPAEPGGLAGEAVRRIAESAGLVCGPDGRYVLRESNGRERYCLYDRSGASLAPAERGPATLQALSLAMDVPRTPETARSYESMTRLARDLANALGGRLVDDNARALDEGALAAIGAQLDGVRRQLEAQGVAPGSALALRLFS